jgi:hypothetical protein
MSRTRRKHTRTRRQQDTRGRHARSHGASPRAAPHGLSRSPPHLCEDDCLLQVHFGQVQRDDRLARPRRVRGDTASRIVGLFGAPPPPCRCAPPLALCKLSSTVPMFPCDGSESTDAFTTDTSSSSGLSCGGGSNSWMRPSALYRRRRAAFLAWTAVCVAPCMGYSTAHAREGAARSPQRDHASKATPRRRRPRPRCPPLRRTPRLSSPAAI